MPICKTNIPLFLLIEQSNRIEYNAIFNVEDVEGACTIFRARAYVKNTRQTKNTKQDIM